MNQASTKESQHNRTCYKLDQSKIQIGDVLLTTSDAWLSSAIRKATNSDFSHAAIFVHEGGVVIEAVHPNVKLTSTIGKVIKDKKNIKILRPNSSTLNKTELCATAKSHIFKDYSIAGALLCPIQNPGFSSPRETELFCSQLIATSFLDCGFPLTSKKPSNTTPEDIATSKLMTDITDEVLIEVESKNLTFETFIEHGNKKDLSHEFHELVSSIVRETTKNCPFIEAPGVRIVVA